MGKPEDFEGRAVSDVPCIKAVNEGNVQYTANSIQQVNDDCHTTNAVLCL